jgi:RNA polymerase primary sigma factor
MPKPSAIKHPLLRGLVRELRLVSRDALLRDVERIEELAADIDDATEYPLDWLIFRITGFRSADPQGTDPASPATIRGRDVLTDLSAVCEHLCAMAGLRHAELDAAQFSRPRELCAAWSISESTFKRLRREGLACRLVLDHRNVGSLIVHQSVAAVFERTHRPRLTTTRGKARMPAALRERLIREALRYHRTLNLSAHAISTRLALRHGPSPSASAIRSLLAKHPLTKSLFPLRAHPVVRSRLALFRLHLRGVLPEDLARMASRRTPLVRRDLALARAQLLRRWCELELLVPFPQSKDSPNIDATLATPCATASLRDPLPDDLASLLAWWLARKPLTPREERDLLWAFAAARGRAWTLTHSLDRLHPSPLTLDDAETHSRWASLLHDRLLHTQGRLILDTIRVRTQLPAEQLPLALLQSLLRAGVRSLSAATLGLDPAKSGRLAGAAALVIDRAITRILRDSNWSPATTSKRAQSMLASSIPTSFALIADTGLLPWDRWLWPLHTRMHAAQPNQFARLPTKAATILTHRFALDGSPPLTLEQIRTRLNMSTIEIAGASCNALALLRTSYPAT